MVFKYSTYSKQKSSSKIIIGYSPSFEQSFQEIGFYFCYEIVIEYPIGLHTKALTEEKLYKAISKAGAKNVAKKAAETLVEVMSNTEHLVGRQQWIIKSENFVLFIRVRRYE
ncbi:hypothetical protein ACFY4F_12420 [Peribacillus butanolivorans]|uniref:hypothetical protein n=1 Tax=Peribacillus butanolivorans TaxID=421767 RepID=UPI003688CC3E